MSLIKSRAGLDQDEFSWVYWTPVFHLNKYFSMWVKLLMETVAYSLKRCYKQGNYVLKMWSCQHGIKPYYDWMFQQVLFVIPRIIYANLIFPSCLSIIFFYNVHSPTKSKNSLIKRFTNNRNFIHSLTTSHVLHHMKVLQAYCMWRCRICVPVVHHN